jgi:hypothetical protein
VVNFGFKVAYSGDNLDFKGFDRANKNYASMNDLNLRQESEEDREYDIGDSFSNI